MTIVTLYDQMGNIIIELQFPRGKMPKLSKILKQWPATERVVVV